jgi:carboxyl-terminal processing protease
LRSDEVLDTYLDVLAHVYDPHSDYLGHEEMESFSIGMNLSLFGIGATLEEADGYCTILELVPGGPAARSGLLKVGDRVVAVAQPGRQPVDVMNMTLDRVVELIRGPKGTTVTLKVIPASALDGSPARTVSLVRDRIELEDEEAKASIVDLTTGHGHPLRIGVIDLPSFYEDMDGPEGRSASADVARLLAKLKAERVRGIVLDLRDNPGGSLDEAIRVTGLFIPKGPVVQTREAQGDVDVESDPDPTVLYDGPLVVLTSRLSASASEILAGALQDYGRAILVGDTSTFGKGTVQDVVPLGRLMDRIGLPHAYDPGALKVTIRKFYRPSGASMQLRGVASDIVLPSPSGVGRVGESTLDDALAWDSVAPAAYRRLDRVRPYLEALRRLSAHRVATDPALRDLQAQIARLGERLAARSISLNEGQRRAQLAKQEEERAALDRDARADASAGPVSYPITLESASSPGLRTTAASPANGAPPAVRSSADAPRDVANARSSPNDLVLHAAERILGDYVDMLARPRSGTPG